MGETATASLLHIAPDVLGPAFDHMPSGYRHELHTLPLFQPDALEALARKFEGHPHDYFVAASAATPGTAFYAVPTKAEGPEAALRNLHLGRTRVLLKRPENHDPQFRALLDALFDEVRLCLPELRGERIARIESGVLITSQASTTPFHFDPEVGFFCQIEGRKSYHLYPPDNLSEPELEQFYVRGRVDIGQVDIARRDASREFVFELEPGHGLHQPRNAPHWVQTHGSRSVSYTMVFETESSRVRARARGMNHYLRKAGLAPTPPGLDIRRDAAKSRVMLAMNPLRHAAQRAKRAFG